MAEAQRVLTIAQESAATLQGISYVFTQTVSGAETVFGTMSNDTLNDMQDKHESENRDAEQIKAWQSSDIIDHEGKHAVIEKRIRMSSGNASDIDRPASAMHID